MNIETKFYPGDHVWFCEDRKFNQGVIKQYQIGFSSRHVVIEYKGFDRETTSTLRSEDEVFLTPEELGGYLANMAVKK